MTLGSTLFLTLHDVLAFSCPVLSAELCVVEISIEFRGDVGFPVNLRGLFICRFEGVVQQNFVFSVYLYRCDETREPVKIINSLSGFISLLWRLLLKRFNICKFSLYNQCLFIDVMNRFNIKLRISRETGFVSPLWTTMSISLWLLATYLWLYLYYCLFKVEYCIKL
jgi:hypothetical protein